MSQGRFDEQTDSRYKECFDKECFDEEYFSKESFIFCWIAGDRLFSKTNRRVHGTASHSCGGDFRGCVFLQHQQGGTHAKLAHDRGEFSERVSVLRRLTFQGFLLAAL